MGLLSFTKTFSGDNKSHKTASDRHNNKKMGLFGGKTKQDRSMSLPTPATPLKSPAATTTTTATPNRRNSTTVVPSDVPVNIHVQQKGRRGALMTNNIKNNKNNTSTSTTTTRTRTSNSHFGNSGNHWSSYSLVSLPSIKRGISERLENPYLWDYDEDKEGFGSYDINEEIKEESYEDIVEEYDDDNNANNYHDNEEEEISFFAANPLPSLVFPKLTDDATVDDDDEVQAPRPRRPPARTGSGAAVTPAAKATTTTTTTPTTTMVLDLPVGNPSFSTPDVTRDLVKRFISDIWNRRKLHLIPHVCSPKIRFNNRHESLDKLGHEGFCRVVESIHESLSDYHCEIHSMCVEGNKAFCRLRFRGKHVGTLLGYPPTGQIVTWQGATEFTCMDGKILKVWELCDAKALEEQLQGHCRHAALRQDNNNDNDDDDDDDDDDDEQDHYNHVDRIMMRM